MQAWEEKIYLKQEGREEGETRVSLLTRQLLKARRYEDLERAAEDPAYRKSSTGNLACSLHRRDKSAEKNTCICRPYMLE